MLLLFALCSISFIYTNREDKLAKPLLTIKDEAITTAIEDVIRKDPGRLNVLLIFVDSNINNSLSVGIAALDSFSVARYLGPRVGDVKGALAYRKHILLVSGNATEKIFGYSDKAMPINILSLYELKSNTD
ncbi:hypothetical protein [Mucilaginibacter lacusdianchii]|uniref:hypothetical protein n=1 Tax=Mucilaginibacter lacusdianchii TaxID=2684211 RepID=UPI00131E6678|nr:hypothetical protein [Mucilaginibacter sp. JXJ CY 39]